MPAAHKILLTAAALAAIATTSAFAQSKPTFKDSHFTKHADIEGDDSDQRAAFDAGNRAYPATKVAATETAAAKAAAALIATSPADDGATWQQVGPLVPNVAPSSTYTGLATTDSGRVTSLAVSPTCRAGGGCILFVGAAGGGIFRSSNALDAVPTWAPSGNGLPSTAIGTIAFDPTDPSGRTLYVGTGEPNGSSDSEAGLGLFRSTDLGNSWTPVPGSVTIAANRAISAVAVDPVNAAHLYVGTAVARHGASSSNGGRFTPPAAPPVGLYESWNGGRSFTLAFSLPSDAVDPTTANGSDFFRGGISKIQISRTGLAGGAPSRVYFSVFDYGLYRSTAAGGYEQVFASAGQGTVAASSTSRTEFALAPMGRKLRIYVGDADANGLGTLYRTDDAGAAKPVWIALSNPTPGTPGFSSYNFCETQCTYDMFLMSPEGHPDTLWLGGSMNYNEIFTATPPSNGRAVQRSTNAGVSFTDMTDDARTPLPLGMHPDQHALAFVADRPDIAFVGSDGGVIRTDGRFVDASAGCATRGLTAAADLTDCQTWLKAIPRQLTSLNAGLATLQFENIAFNPKDPLNDLIGGTQDNGTWVYDGHTNTWFETIGGDGGSAGINAVRTTIRMHTYYDAQVDVNFQPASAPLGWDWVADPLLGSGEAQSFYVPLIADPVLDGTFFVGLEHVWRTQDNGGPQAYLDLHCNEYSGDFSVTCGDWQPVGPSLIDTTFGTDKGGSYVVAIERARVAGSPLWVGTRRGRLFISANPDAATVEFTRIDTPAQPERFVSGIAVDPANPLRAIVSFSGYQAYTPTTPGHVFEVIYDPRTQTAKWTDLSDGIGDQPVTGVAFDAASGRIFAATDFGVLVKRHRGWAPAAYGLPPVAVYGLAFDAGSRTLYAATHGRGVWRVRLGE